MIKGLIYAMLGVGAAGAFSICDLCKSSAASASSVSEARAAAAPLVAPAAAVRVLPTAATVETVRLKVKGMTCGGCVVGTRKVLTQLPGVTKADVSYERQEAVVTYDPAKVTVAQMIAAIKVLGYTATVSQA